MRGPPELNHPVFKYSVCPRHAVVAGVVAVVAGGGHGGGHATVQFGDGEANGGFVEHTANVLPGSTPIHVFKYQLLDTEAEGEAVTALNTNGKGPLLPWVSVVS